MIWLHIRPDNTGVFICIVCVNHSNMILYDLFLEIIKKKQFTILQLDFDMYVFLNSSSRMYSFKTLLM